LPGLDPGAIRGHVACSLLALVLKKELEDRLAAANNSARPSWPDVIADLDSLTETEIEQDGKPFLLRSSRAPPPPTRSPPLASPCRQPCVRSQTPNLQRKLAMQCHASGAARFRARDQ
jgi:hypothetical protein